MSQIASLSDIKALGTILTVWAHPDDETFTCGGIMATAVANGQQVVCITATKGEKGVQDAKRWPPEQLGDIRAEELSHALSVLGVKDHHWLGYSDGGCKEVPPQEAGQKLAEFIKQYQPDTILTFGPEGMTGHEDHCAVSRWVDEAVKQAQSKTKVYHAVELRENYQASLAADKQFNIFFNIAQPPLVEEAECDILFKLPDELMIKKYKALLAMPSQFEAMCKAMGEETISRMLCNEAFIIA